MVPVTPTKRARIVHMREEGKKFSEIAERLKISRSSASRNYYTMRKQRDPYYVKPGRGRKRLLSERDLRNAERHINIGDVRDGADVHRDLFPDVSARCVRKSLQRVGLNGRIRREKPLLTDAHKKKRRAWANEHADWDQLKWSEVWFSDESKFLLHGSDGKKYCCRRPGQEFLERNVKKTVKHGGGSLMVWGVITPEGVGRLYRIEGIMDGKQYVRILKSALLGTVRDYDTEISDFILAQDNDPKHNSRVARDFYDDKGLCILPWPPQSPDMNLIEYLWNHLDDLVRARNPLPKNIEELWAALEEEWYKIDVGYIQSLYERMQDRVAALKAAKGSYTRY